MAKTAPINSVPITPASELLHTLSRHRKFGVHTIQAEDEIAAANMALGAAFSGRLAVTATSGPGMDLKAETVSLAVAMELPMVIVDVQRAGPSTGMPTKTEQSDLLTAMYGRHGESPLPVVAASTPAGCFQAAIEAVRLAVKYRTPVILLSDTFLANSSEPWRLPSVDDLPEIDPAFANSGFGLHAAPLPRRRGMLRHLGQRRVRIPRPELVAECGEENGRGLAADAGNREQNAGDDAGARGLERNLRDDVPTRRA